jgi:hypothetical protein
MLKPRFHHLYSSELLYLTKYLWDMTYVNLPHPNRVPIYHVIYTWTCPKLEKSKSLAGIYIKVFLLGYCQNISRLEKKDMISSFEIFGNLGCPNTLTQHYVMRQGRIGCDKCMDSSTRTQKPFSQMALTLSLCLTTTKNIETQSTYIRTSQYTLIYIPAKLL